MKRTDIKWLSCCMGVCMVAGAAFAQADVNQPPSTSSDRATTYSRSDTATSGQYLRSKDLVGTNVKDSRGEKVGDIRELYLNPQNGAAFATIDITGSRDAVVPVQALKISRTKGVLKDRIDVTINKTESDLTAGPTLNDNELNKLDDPSFTEQIFAAFNLHMPSATGGAETPGGTSTRSTTQEHR